MPSEPQPLSGAKLGSDFANQRLKAVMVIGQQALVCDSRGFAGDPFCKVRRVVEHRGRRVDSLGKLNRRGRRRRLAALSSNRAGKLVNRVRQGRDVMARRLRMNRQRRRGRSIRPLGGCRFPDDQHRVLRNLRRQT